MSGRNSNRSTSGHVVVCVFDHVTASEHRSVLITSESFDKNYDQASARVKNVIETGCEAGGGGGLADGRDVGRGGRWKGGVLGGRDDVK